ncbi:hypothetical protein JTE90_012090 [Oedothorax gibbosus]|uniref:Uncharacterized protein n=1 Tax=Oedothorax gibbosus TaxID=931172 RepID=A0AAV6UMJ5_9ARAC|nr:hypothetical protein JTE90_012090 [Oedothorax gibbosus]
MFFRQSSRSRVDFLLRRRLLSTSWRLFCVFCKGNIREELKARQPSNIGGAKSFVHQQKFGHEILDYIADGFWLNILERISIYVHEKLCFIAIYSLLLHYLKLCRFEEESLMTEILDNLFYKSVSKDKFLNEF